MLNQNTKIPDDREKYNNYIELQSSAFGKIPVFKK